MAKFTSRKDLLSRFVRPGGSDPKQKPKLLDTEDQQVEPQGPEKKGRSKRTARTPQPRKPWKFSFLKFLFWLGFFSTLGGGSAVVWGWWLIESDLPDTSAVFSFVRDGTLTIKAYDGVKPPKPKVAKKPEAATTAEAKETADSSSSDKKTSDKKTTKPAVSTPPAKPEGMILQQIGPATREKLKIAQVPPRLAQAFIATEDRRFYQHDGVDYQGVLRAVASNIEAGNVVEGGSTITQQLARIVFLNQERSIWRKLKEAMLAQKLEQELPKDQILERYLNLVYLGSGAYGIADAAWVYFSKTVDQLSLSEMAMIAGLPPAPSEYSPLVNIDAAKARRDVVLDRMEEAGFITASEAEAARSSPLKLKPSPPKRLQVEAPYFTTYIQQQLPKYVSPEALEVGGLIVETTLNVEWQRTAEKVVKNAIQQYGPGQGFEQAALVAIDPKTGEVKAMMGGLAYGESQFNRVTQAQRQPGSSFKTFLYTAAIASGMSPYDGYLDAPYNIDGYQPQNASRKHYGWMNLREALTQSVNVIAVKLLLDVGFDPVIKMARDMGVQSEMKKTYSLALGASEMNLMELTSGYGTLAAQGLHFESHGIRRIINRKGEILFDAKRKLKPKRAVDKGSASIMTWMLQGVVQSGTGGNAQLDDRSVAGKTGTSEEARDLWFIGYIPQLVTGVWLGNDDSSPTWGASSTSALIWYEFMSQATKGMPVEKFPALPDLEGRKGSIKAKPFRPGRESSGTVQTEERSAPQPSQPAPREEPRPVKPSEARTPTQEPDIPHAAPEETVKPSSAPPTPASPSGGNPTAPVEPAAPPASSAPVVEPEPPVAPLMPSPEPPAPLPPAAPAPAPAPTAR